MTPRSFVATPGGRDDPGNNGSRRDFMQTGPNIYGPAGG
jgi:hypothetical protein